MRGWLVVVLAGCGRIAFDPIGVPPLVSFRAEPNVGGREREIRITYEVGDASGGEHLEIRRAAPQPPVDCNDGEVVTTTTQLASATVIDRVTDGWHPVHGYRACMYDTAGHVTSTTTMVASNVRYFNPGPNCTYPPCSNPAPTRASSGMLVRSPAPLTAINPGGQAMVTDLDGDDDLDVVTTSGNPMYLHRNDGTGTFAPAVAINTRPASVPRHVMAADFTNDGVKDVVIMYTTGPVYFHQGLGGGAVDLERAIPGSAGVDPDMVAAADINDDGFLDLVVALFSDPDVVFLGDGQGGFTQSTQLLSGSNNTCVNCAVFQDIDGDDVAELVLGYNSGTERLDIYHSLGDGTFGAPYSVPYDPNAAPIAVRLADLDGDGTQDVVVGRSQSGGVYVTYGDGHGSFTTLSPLAATTTARCVGLVANDFDGDGDVDIVFSQDNAGTIGYLPNANGSFGPQVDLDGGSTWSTANLEAGDLDGDGVLDMVVGADTGTQIFFGR